MSINIAIVGVGNCASSLYQGFTYYKNKDNINGVMRNDIGGYTIGNINVVAAFDIDRRKVGKTLKEAIMSKPNCTPIYVDIDSIPDGPLVQMSPLYDGVSDHMLEAPEDSSFRINNNCKIENIGVIVQTLKERKVDILINYLPVGSIFATEWYANICLLTGISFLNCIPVFIASNPIWEKKFIDRGIPIIGDDMKSQFGASILSQMLQELAFERGHKVKCHIQRNIGGNTDFLNMTNQDRLVQKKISKENVIRSQNDIRDIPQDDTFYHAGPSEYIGYYGDNKVANIHMEMEGFMGAPVTLDAQLSVIDSPNSAGVVTDAIRYLKVAREMGIRGSLRGPSAFTQKTPPQQLSFKDAIFECDALANREYTDITRLQVKE